MATLLHRSAPGGRLEDTLRDADSGAGGRGARRLSAARNLGLVLGGQAGLSACRFAGLLVLSHLLPPPRFDECAIYASSSLVIGTLCELGINISCLKFTSGLQGEEWMRNVSRFLALRLALTGGIVAAVFLFAPYIAGSLLKHPAYAHALRLACASAAAASLASFALVLLQSRLEFRRMSRLTGAAAVLQIVPVLAALRHPQWGMTSLFAGDLISRLWIVAANLGMLAAVSAAARRSGPRPAWKSIALFANWITLSTAIGTLYNYVPSIALSRWASVSALGTYSLGAALAGGLGLLINTISTVLLPEAVTATTVERRRRYLGTYLPGAALLGGALLAGTWLGGGVVRHLLPAAMPEAVRVFQLLASAQAVLLVANPIQFLLYGAGRPEWCAASDGLITLLFAMLAVWLAPVHGAIGVASALLITQTSVKTALSAALGLKGWGLGTR